AGAATPESVTPEERLEHVPESEHVTRRAPGPGARSGVAEEVVAAAARPIPAPLVGDAAPLAALLGLRVVAVPVGVVPTRQVTIRALDLLVRRGPGDAEHLVVVALAHDRCRPSWSEIVDTAAKACW